MKILRGVLSVLIPSLFLVRTAPLMALDQDTPGFHLVAVDDCGNPAQEAHLVEGRDGEIRAFPPRQPECFFDGKVGIEVAGSPELVATLVSVIVRRVGEVAGQQARRCGRPTGSYFCRSTAARTGGRPNHVGKDILGPTRGSKICCLQIIGDGGTKYGKRQPAVPENRA